jgi:hypothetical protein
MKVRGWPDYPEVKKKYKKKFCTYSVYMLVVHDISHTDDVYLYKSVKPSSCSGRVHM